MVMPNGNLGAAEVIDVVTANCHSDRKTVTDVLNGLWRVINRPIAIHYSEVKCHRCGAPLNREADNSGLYCTATPDPTHSPTALRFISVGSRLQATEGEDA